MTYTGNWKQRGYWPKSSLKISSGYMGQLIEWPEVVTEGPTLEESRELLKDALHEMVLAYRKQRREVPLGGALLEQVAIEV